MIKKRHGPKPDLNTSNISSSSSNNINSKKLASTLVVITADADVDEVPELAEVMAWLKGNQEKEPETNRTLEDLLDLLGQDLVLDLAPDPAVAAKRGETVCWAAAAVGRAAEW